MNVKKIVLTYLLTTVVFFAVDLVWLALVAKNFYRKHLGPMLAEQVNWTAAPVFYLLFIAGILVFAVFPAVKKNSLGLAVLFGCFFGLVAYATYDLTNLATLRGFPTIVALVDLVWGTVLSGVVATAGFFIARRLG